MKKILKSVGAGAVLFVYSAISTGATIIVENGALMGATGVDVNGVLYDVSFQDGSCFDLYNGCNDISGIPFTDLTSANAARTALLNQVFIDSPLGLFDSNTTLTNGCFVEGSCTTFFPVVISGVIGTYFVWNRNPQPNEVGAGGLDPLNDTSIRFPDGDTYAVWSQSTVVPVPAAIWLFGSGLLGLVGFSNRKKKPNK